MNGLMTADASATMNSMDLLELINAERTEFGESEVRRNDFTARCKDELEGEHYESFVVTNPNGTTSEALSLTHDQCMLVAMRESKGVRRSVQAKLKARQSVAALVPQSMPEALRLAAEAIEQRDHLALVNKAQAETLAETQPKAQALDLIAAGEKSITIRETAKLLGIKENRLTSWLHEHEWVYRMNGRWVAKQPHIQAGRLIYKEARYTDEKTGQEVYAPYCHITPKGLAKLAHEFSTVPA